MIDRIESVQNLGPFGSFIWDQEAPDFTKYNLVLGYNGSGKSTLSNVLRLYSDKEGDGGRLLFGAMADGRQEASVVIRAAGKRIHFQADGQKLPVYVFNSDFTADHVYQGAEFKFRPFDNTVVTKEQLKSPKIAALESQIAALKSSIEAIETEKQRIEAAFETAKKALSKELNARIKGSRMPPVSLWHATEGEGLDLGALRRQLDSLYGRYELSARQEELQRDSDLLRGLGFGPLAADPAQLSLCLHKEVAQEACKKVEDNIARWRSCKLKHVTLDEWFEDGSALLVYAKEQRISECPLCGSPVERIISTLITNLEGYFNREYADLMDDLGRLDGSFGADAETVLENRNSMSSLRTIAERYRSLRKDTPWEPPGDDKEITAGIRDAIAKVALKRGDVQRADLEPGKSLPAALQAYADTVHRANTERDGLLSALGAAMVDPAGIITQIRELIPKVCNATADLSGAGNQLARHERLVVLLGQATQDLQNLVQQRSQEVASLRKESVYVNGFLRRLGIAHFEISTEDQAGTENPVVRYKGGHVSARLRHSLSEGEKTALAFAYFLSKMEYELRDNANADISSATVVIDDPVSSLDEERLHCTACLIHDRTEECAQLIVLSHNIPFMRFLSNVVGYPRTEANVDRTVLRHDYYLCAHTGTLKSLPAQLRNYTTSYFQKLDDISRFCRGQIDYQLGKTFLPSYVRVVLEAFFSFKLCLLKQGSSSDAYLTPGLDRIIKGLRGVVGELSDFKTVGEIDATTLLPVLEDIKRITDPQVHGTPNDVTDVRFISESEMKTLCNNTLDIITFVDGIHASRTLAKDAS